MRRRSLALLFVIFAAAPWVFSQDFQEILSLALSGDVQAQTWVGNAYYFGEGVPRNDVEAAFFYFSASLKGYAPAMYNLAVMYETGQGVDKNDKVAVTWYRSSADRGHGYAQYELGRRHFTGRGVNKDYSLAWFWLYLAGQSPEVVLDPDMQAACMKLKELLALELPYQDQMQAMYKAMEWRPLTD